MNGILGMAQMLQVSDLPEAERIEYAGVILTSGRLLLRLLNDVLDLSKIEAGKLSVVAEAFDPESVIRDCMDLFAVTARQKGLRMERIAGDLKARFYVGDADRIGSMLANLVSNALKFTSAGRISVKDRKSTRLNSSH